MNWVGGSRSRLMKSSDVKKQREFFEKKKRQKLNQLKPPASPKEGNTGNIDLLTMFIVNQIALKKEHAGKPKKTYISSSNGKHKSVGYKHIKLPMSPCSPSRLNLVQSDSQFSVHTVGLKKRKQSLLEEFKFKALSPVLEAVQSDNSASDYKHRHHRLQSSVSSFSSPSSTPETFKSRPTTYISPQPSWEPSCSQSFPPKEVYQYDPWTVCQTSTAQISIAAGAQFGTSLHSTVHNSPEINGPSIYSADEYPCKLVEREVQQEEPLFLGFPSEEYRGQDLFSEEMIKINLQKKTPPCCTTSLDFTELHNRDHSADFSSQESRYSDFRVQPIKCVTAGNKHSSFSQNTCEIPISYSQRERGLSLHTSETQSVKIPEETQDMGTQTAAVSTSTSRDASVQCCLLKAGRRQSTLPEHKASINRNRTCQEKKAKASTTRRQTGKSNENLLNGTQCALSENHKVKWNTPWKTSATQEASQQTTEAIAGQKSSCKSQSLACTNKHVLPTLHSSHSYVLESNENPSGNMLVREKRCEGHKEGSVNQNPAENAWSTEERSSERSVNWVSGETETLQEIADILLMLKQKNKH